MLADAAIESCTEKLDTDCGRVVEDDVVLEGRGLSNPATTLALRGTRFEWFCWRRSILARQRTHLSGSFLAATAAWIILTKQVLQTAWCAQGNVCMVARFVAQTTHCSSGFLAASCSTSSNLSSRPSIFELSRPSSWSSLLLFFFPEDCPPLLECVEEEAPPLPLLPPPLW